MPLDLATDPLASPLSEEQRDEQVPWSTSERAPKEAHTFLSYESTTEGQTPLWAHLPTYYVPLNLSVSGHNDAVLI